ncbi:MAG TPA: deoxyribodipyrimidine photo-lyase [Kiritimatiellia bacterium]|nr:deoxyribodipyrimidine photo-lyase [Kiritimatiellia bacterium]
MRSVKHDGGSIVWWIRRDLRIADNPALLAAVESGLKIIPVFIWAPDEEEPWAPGAASRWWLHYSLKRLQGELEKRHSALIIRKGPSLPALRSIILDTSATHVVWNRLYEPAVIERDKMIKTELRSDGIIVKSFNGHLLFEPWTIETQQGNPYQVFTPFYKACGIYGSPGNPHPAPKHLTRLTKPPWSLSIDDLTLLPALDWAKGMRETWTPGEGGAIELLNEFRNRNVTQYKSNRDRPDLTGTSRLSPHLHFGEISPRQIWHACEKAVNAEPYLRQLIWREFAHHLLFHFPHTPEQPLRENFAAFPWEPNKELFRSWRKGRTGYPIVDAGMNELWHTGWMHNRVRMIVASFLVKDLLIPWQEGARWFWDTLVDADLANNTLGWQWTAGCGADAAPYFRIFNPALQAVKFDPEGAYVKRWLPALRGLPAPDIHRIYELNSDTLQKAGVSLGTHYPRPLVNHAEARDKALEAYTRIK